MSINQRTVDKLDKIGHKYRCKLCLPPFNGRFNLFYDVREIKPSLKSKLCTEIKKMKLNPIPIGYTYGDYDFVELDKA
jgi:hypothetical protein